MDRSSSFCRNTSCSSFDDDKWQKEFKMHEDLMPSELRKKFYDVLVLYCENNRADARKFCDHLKNDIKLNNDICVNAALYDEIVHQAGPKCKLLEIAIERSTYIFFFMTKEFCEDAWIELSREECLMEAIYNEEKKWCVVPPGKHGENGNSAGNGTKIKGKDVNEVVLTGASQEHQRTTTYQGSENCTNGDLNSQTWEHQSQENDMTLNNSMQAVDHLLQEESANLTEPASQGPSVFGNLPNMSLIDSQDSRMATSTMNLVNEDKEPLQGENPTGASHDKTDLPDFDALTLNTSFDWTNMMSNDQSETSDMASSPLSQKPRGKSDANTASMVLNIYHVENLQLGKKSSIIKLKQTEEKSTNEADNSNTVTGDMVHNEHNGEDSQKPVDLPIPDSRSLSELKDEPVSVSNQQGSRQRQDCMNHSSRNINGLKLSLLLKNNTEAEEEEKQTLGTSLKADIESWKVKEEGWDTNVNMRDQYSHLGARPKNLQKKPVGQTDLNTVSKASSNETEAPTVQDTSLKLVAEPKATKRGKLWSDVNQYQVTWRAPLLVRAFPFILLMPNSTDDDPFFQDEVD